MKTIGIKLADGSFYPVLQEGSPAVKKLDLTTAHNNQTKVMVDLYRSATCSMEDAEYVDSLQIDNLVAHPNGEPDLSFSLSLDEDNQLSANILDPETGKESNSEITLVSRTEEERLVTDEYDISDSKEKTSNGKAFAAGAVAGAGLLAAAAALRAKDQTENAEQTTEEIPDFSENASPEITETTEDSTFEEPTTEPTIDDFSIEDIADPTEDSEEQSQISDSTEDTAIFDEDSTDTEPEISDQIPDFDDTEFNQPENSENTSYDTENFEEEPTSEENSEDQTQISDFDENTTDFEEQPISDNSDENNDEINFDFPGDDTADYVGNNDQTIVADEDTGVEETDNSLDDFSTDSIENSQDFDLPNFPEDDNSETTEENQQPSDDFFNMDDDEFKDSSNNADESPAAGGISFTGLYDQDDLNENGSKFSDEETEDEKKKTKAPVIICIICAIICIIATLLILFIVPSKYNLITKKNSEDKVQTQQVAQAEVKEETPVVEEVAPEAPKEEIPPAKEDEVVIIEKAEEVVPEQPPVAEEKPENITYKIKWGDTLWDISDTYYKNPWRYKYIARWNGIKNPDHIISGTYIEIPAQ